MIIYNPSIVVLVTCLAICLALTSYLLYELFRSRGHTKRVERREKGLRFAETLQDFLIDRVFNGGEGGEGFAELTLQGEFLRADSICGTLVGWKPDSLVGKRESNLASLETIEEYANLMERVLSGEIPSFTLQKSYTGEDGLVRKVTITKYVVRSVTGAPKGFFKVFRRG